MDFDVSKENIQPLRGGRNVAQLGVALQAQNDADHQTELVHQREEFERLIRTYTGDDPLENWYHYVSWAEQSYPKQGHEGNLVPLLEHCLKIFENDERYCGDRRLCKLFIKYIDQQQNPVELYHMMYAQGICRNCADIYRAWAYYYEAAGDFQNAHKVFECGKHELAQPFDELQLAHNNLFMAAGQHMICGPNERSLMEKRQALTSLKTLKPGQVGSIRHASHSTLGPFGSAATSKSNADVAIYEDNGEEERGAEAAPNSIVTAAKRQNVTKENTLKPGPWTTIPVKKKQAIHRATPSFTVHEDCDDDGVAITSNNFVPATLENYSDWIISLKIPEPVDSRMIPMYPKNAVYAEINTEYSLEQLRARRYLAQKQQIKVSSPFNNEKQENMNQGAASEQNITSTLVFVKDETDSEAPIPTNNWSKEISDSGGAHNFDLWNSFQEVPAKSPEELPRASAPKFSIYEQSNVGLQRHIEPKGSAMKTPFKDLNAEELAETGSRGGMDVAAAAPVDSAKRLPIFEDDSSSSFDKMADSPVNPEDTTCNTQMFYFNLNQMQVSTPHTKQQQQLAVRPPINNAVISKQLFMPKTDEENKLSTILEETKNFGQSSSSSGATTKSSIFTTKQTNMVTISEEHNSYLAQNLMANAALRSSLLGNFMDIGTPSPVEPSPPARISADVSLIPSPADVRPLEFIPSDPFKQSLLEGLLQRVNFPGPHTDGYYCLANIPKLMVRKESVYIGPERYIIEKQLGKGTYGTVFRGIEFRTRNTVAIKFQKPANKWEFYICRELRSRLVNHPLRERFMDVTVGYFSEQASVLVSEFMPCGSLLDVANQVKQKSGRPMKESLCIHFCLEMLRVVQAMHEVKVIHADIKPDNFLVQLYPNDVVGLQLIDFGCSIDMSLFPPGTNFTRKVTTEDFICCEMRDNRPWSYHTDLFCIAATAHVLLFEKYIQMQKRDGHWSISNRLPRYARLDLWNMFFSTLLNQQNGPADSVTLQAMLEDSLNHKFDDYHNELRFITNMLKKR